MKPRDVRTYLYDMLQAIDLIGSFVDGHPLDQYEANIMLRSAVERQLAILGEALRQLLTVEPGIRNEISSVRQVIVFRNVLIHGYANISNDIVWAAIQADLPILQREVNGLLQRYDR